MRFANHTPVPAALVRNAEEGDCITALVLAALTYRLTAQGDLQLAPVQRPLELRPDKPHPHDAMLLKECASVCATGFVYPAKPPAPTAVARLQVGARELTIVAFGPRVWYEGASGKLTPSPPRPFERVAMTWENAYGGYVRAPAFLMTIDGEQTIVPPHIQACPYNPDGTGFYLDRDQAREQPLPQLENPAELITGYRDQPKPVCFAPCPLWSGLRSELAIADQKLDPAGLERLPSRAAPAMTFTDVPPGTPVVLSGMRPGGQPLQFTVPELPLDLIVVTGAGEQRSQPRLDAVDIDAEATEIRLLYRGAFTYDLVQLDIRSATLEPNDDFPQA